MIIQKNGQNCCHQRSKILNGERNFQFASILSQTMTWYAWLQYRILNKIFGTKSLLFKMSIEDNNVCRNCGCVEETTEHLFFYCKNVTGFLSELYSCIKAMAGINCQFRIDEVLFGIVKRENNSDSLST